MLGIDSRAARYTWTAAVVVLLIALVYTIRQTLLIFIIALLLAYLLYPLMDFIDRRLPGKTRTLSLAITFLLGIGLIVGFGVILGSIVVEQASNLAHTAPEFLARLQQTPAPGPQAVKSLKDQIVGAVLDQIRNNYDAIASVIPRLSFKVLSASSNLIYLVIIPILSFFILRDGREIRDNILSMFDRQRELADETLMDIHRLLLQYMRALLSLCAASFVAYGIVLSIMGVPYAILLASIAFPMEFVPLVGPLASAVIVIGVSIVTGYPHVLWVVIFLGIYRMFQDYVLSPRLMSQGVELHPLLVIFGVFAGGEVGGVAGIFLSVPTLAMIRLLYHQIGKASNARRLRATTSVSADTATTVVG